MFFLVYLRQKLLQRRTCVIFLRRRSKQRDMYDIFYQVKEIFEFTAKTWSLILLSKPCFVTEISRITWFWCQKMVKREGGEFEGTAFNATICMCELSTWCFTINSYLDGQFFYGLDFLTGHLPAVVYWWHNTCKSFPSWNTPSVLWYSPNSLAGCSLQEHW